MYDKFYDYFKQNASKLIFMTSLSALAYLYINLHNEKNKLYEKIECQQIQIIKLIKYLNQLPKVSCKAWLVGDGDKDHVYE